VKIVLLFIGSLLPIVASAVYVLSIIRGKSRPHRMTRLLLMLITGLSSVSLLAGHDRSGVWLALVSFVQSVIIWLLSLKWGMGGRERLDFVCFGLCAMGIVLWLASGTALVGLVASIVADFIAIVPSLRKTIRLPHTEDGVFYALDVVAGSLVLFAGPLAWRSMLFPGYIALINVVFVTVIYCSPHGWRRRVGLSKETQDRTGRL
jgi:hypothetical protein